MVLLLVVVIVSVVKSIVLVIGLLLLLRPVLGRRKLLLIQHVALVSVTELTFSLLVRRHLHVFNASGDAYP